MKKTEIFTLAVIAIGAAAEFADMLPSKYGGALLFLWAIVRAYLRVTGQREEIDQAQSLGAELKGDIEQARAVKAEPVNK